MLFRSVASLGDPAVREKLDDYTFNEVTEQLAMLDGAGNPFDLEAIRAGRQTPVYFGSAVNNFGIQLLLDGFLSDSVPPAPRRAAKSVVTVSMAIPAGTDDAEGGRVIPVDHGKFSGFVFKIQANMDPKHRDRIAFLRICSGKFEIGRAHV